MRRQDHQRVMHLNGDHYRGGLPDLGKPHPKAGYRWAIGQARYESGKIGLWREKPRA